MRRLAFTSSALVLALIAGCAVIVVPEDGNAQIKSAFGSNAVSIVTVKSWRLALCAV